MVYDVTITIHGCLKFVLRINQSKWFRLNFN